MRAEGMSFPRVQTRKGHQVKGHQVIGAVVIEHQEGNHAA